MKRIIIFLTVVLLVGPVFTQGCKMHTTVEPSLATSEGGEQTVSEPDSAKYTKGEHRRILLRMKANHYINRAQSKAVTSSYTAAIKAQTRAVKFWKKADGDQSSEYAGALNVLAQYNYCIGNYEKAIELATEATGILKEFKDDDQCLLWYVLALKNLANYYRQLDNNKEAIAIMIEEIEVLEEKSNKNNTSMYVSLSLQVANYYWSYGFYEKAVEFQRKAVNALKGASGDMDSDYENVLSKLALYYSELGNCKKAMEISREVFSDLGSDYATFLIDLAKCYRKTENYEELIKVRTETAKIRKETSGEQSDSYKQSLRNLMNDYSYYNQHHDIDGFEYEKAMEFSREVFGDRDLDYASFLEDMADCCWAEEAVVIQTKAVEIKLEILGDRHPDYATALGKLANHYSEYYKYDKAKELQKQALEIIRETEGEHNLDYATSLNYLASYYGPSRDDYEKALELETEALEIWREISDVHSPEFIWALENLATTNDWLGNYELAIDLETQAISNYLNPDPKDLDYFGSLQTLKLFYEDLGDNETAMEISKDVFGDRTTEFATFLANLSDTFKLSPDPVLDYQDFESAIEIATRAMEIRGATLGERNLDYAESLHNLAEYYYHLGDYEKAIEFETEAVEVRREVFGEMNPDYATSLQSLANYYSDIGDYKKAIKFGEEAVKIQRKVLGDGDRQFATSLHNLAACYYAIGNYDKAVKFGTEAVECRLKILGARSSDYAMSLSMLAQSYSQLGDHKKAIELGTKAMEIEKLSSGSIESKYATSLSDLSHYYFNSGDYDKSLEDKQLSQKAYADNLRMNFIDLTAAKRTAFWNNIKEDVESGTRFCIDYPSSGSNELAYDVELFSKGILLSSEMEFDKIIKESGNKELLDDFEQMLLYRKQLEGYYKKPVDERPEDLMKQLEYNAKQLEIGLVARSRRFGDFTLGLAIEWTDVRDTLRKNDLAIEFAKVTADSSAYYVALMLRKGWDAPKCVNLGSADDFVPYLAMASNDLYRSQEFSDKVWAGIVEAADLKEGERVLFSPDGIFYQTAIEYLPAVRDGDATGRTMSEKYQMRRLSSTRELCMEPGSVADDSAVLYGGLRYERKPKTAESQNKSEAADGDVVKSEEKSGQPRDLMIGTLLAQRGADGDTLDRGTIAYLPGTLAEVDTLTVMLQQKNIKHNEYKEYAGKEEKFKAMSGHAPKLIHIATHGFYLSPTEAEELSQQRQRDFLMTDDDSQNKVVDYSMSRTGLLLSESLPAWFGRPVPEDEDDGILTAKEIAGLDLRGVDLAVLSACSTGLGDITGDGVAGLQRGFKKAGVKTLILSLWKVDDDATRQLMTEFYSNYTSGKSKRESFDSAIASLRSDPKYSDPQYWAAFIMLD